MKKTFVLAAFGLNIALLHAGETPKVTSVKFTYKGIEALKREAGVVRRDPSDVIKEGDNYYVYYTKVAKNELPAHKTHLGGSGYPGLVYYASSTDGIVWKEEGLALGWGCHGRRL